MSEGNKEIKVKLIETPLGKAIAIITVLCAIVGTVIAVLTYFRGSGPAVPANSQVYAVGETVHFGEWDWRILDVQGNKALLITENVIETRPYNEEGTAVTWETCTLRTYLNGEFLEKFSARDRKMILLTQNNNPDNPWYEKGKGCGKTDDKVFLLSIEEGEKYFGNGQHNEERMARFNNDRIMWWLRSPGHSQNYAAYIMDDGHVPILGLIVSNYNGGLRPALWLKLT